MIHANMQYAVGSMKFHFESLHRRCFPMAKANYATLFGLTAAWYGFYAGYNAYNEYAGNFRYPIAIAAMQFGVGLIYAVPLWFLGIRKPPKINFDDFLLLAPIAILNAGGHVCTIIAMFQFGGGSLIHVLNASEPLFCLILGSIVNKVTPRLQTTVSLIAIALNLAYISNRGFPDFNTFSRDFNTPAINMAMGSNIAFALRSIMKVNLPTKVKIRCASNEHAVTTILSFLILLPFVYYIEGVPNIQRAYEGIPDQGMFLINAATCGICLYLANEMQNTILGLIGTIPTSVFSTFKGLVIAFVFHFFADTNNYPIPDIYGSLLAVTACYCFYYIASNKTI